jgi:O-antigen/teichoic acid export membrane protein
VGGLLISFFSRLVIANTLGLLIGTLYSSLQIATILSIIEDSFNRAYAPWLYEKLNLNSDQVKLKIVKFTYLYFIVVFIFALILGISSPYLVKILLGKDFSKSAPIIIWIAIGAAFNGMYYMLQIIYFML